jgi:hypothetical protein
LRASPAGRGYRRSKTVGWRSLRRGGGSNHFAVLAWAFSEERSSNEGSGGEESCPRGLSRPAPVKLGCFLDWAGVVCFRWRLVPRLPRHLPGCNNGCHRRRIFCHWVRLGLRLCAHLLLWWEFSRRAGGRCSWAPWSWRSFPRQWWRRRRLLPGGRRSAARVGWE